MSDNKECSSQSCSPSWCSPKQPVQLVKQESRTDTSLPKTPPTACWIIGKVDTPSGIVPVVRTELQLIDTFGSWKVRWGIGRMSFRVPPGLYAVGNPTNASPVFVTANYKMSFDRLRSQLGSMDGWILVLDTKGVNVWCAAGKGTFGTVELLKRIEETGLKDVVSHRRLILPQLSATGVSAHAVHEGSGFHVFYGPVRAKDIPTYMRAGMKATSEMRRVTFTFAERAVLVPVEIVGNLKYAIYLAACFLLLSGIGTGIYSLDRVARFGAVDVLLALLAAVAGAIFPALLLPWLPGRAFSLKGAIAGVVPMLGIVLLWWSDPALFRNWLNLISWLLIFPAVSSFIGMNFTGSSTYTSLSGVKKEMRFAIPAQIGVAACGIGFWLAGLFV